MFPIQMQQLNYNVIRCLLNVLNLTSTQVYHEIGILDQR